VVVAVHSTAVQWYSGTVVQQYSGTGQRGVANLAGPGVGRPPLRRHHKHTDQRFAPHHTTLPLMVQKKLLIIENKTC